MRIPLLTALCLTFSLAASARDNLILGVNEGATPRQMEQEMAGIVAHVNTSPAVSVKLRVFPNHDALYAALRAKEVDLAFLGAMKYVEAHQEMGAVPIVAEGHATRSAIAVPPGSPIKRVEDLRGKRFAFGYPDSTTTHLIPLLTLSKHGLREQDVEGSFAGHQPQKTVNDMLAGKYDACAVSDYTYAQNKAKLHILDESDPYSGPPIVARSDLPVALRTEVQRMFVSYKPRADQMTQHFAKGAVAATDADYNRIRFLAKVLFNKMYK